MTSEHILLVWRQGYFPKWRSASAFATRVMLSTAGAQRVEGGPGPSAVIGDPQAVHAAFSRRNRGALRAGYCNKLKASGSGRISGRQMSRACWALNYVSGSSMECRGPAVFAICTLFPTLMEISLAALNLYHNAIRFGNLVSALCIDIGIHTE